MEQALGNRKCACGHAEHNHVVGLTGGRWTCLILMCPCRQFANAEAVCESRTERPSGGMIHDDGVIQGKNGICKCGHYEDIHTIKNLGAFTACGALGCYCKAFVQSSPERNHAWEAKQPFEGGATRSQIDERYEIIPPEAEAALARRLGLGAVKHGEGNWKHGGVEFVKATVNHLKRHTNMLLDPATTDNDDHIGAVLCNASFLCWFKVKKSDIFRQALKELADGKVEK